MNTERSTPNQIVSEKQEQSDWFRVENCPGSKLEYNLRNSKITNDDIWLGIFNAVPFLSGDEIREISKKYQELKQSDDPKKQFIPVKELIKVALNGQRYKELNLPDYLDKMCFDYNIPKVNNLKELLDKEGGEYPPGGEYSVVFKDIFLLCSVGAVNQEIIYSNPSYELEEVFTITNSGKEFAKVFNSIVKNDILPQINEEERLNENINYLILASSESVIPAIPIKIAKTAQ